jgi:hypothetical protein
MLLRTYRKNSGAFLYWEEMKVFPLLFLSAATLLAETPKKGCDLVTEAEASQLLAGQVKKMDILGGCSFSVAASGLRMSVMPMDTGTGVKTVYNGMVDKNKKAGWGLGAEKGMGDEAYAYLIARSAQSAAGKAGFIARKGPTILQISVSDTAIKQDLAGNKAMLDKLRPLAQKAAGRL